ncbi:hypothetical protein SVI_1914 [Shewanella violacea DSS12]|uniref:Uncharacterized protein n=1 Tax=Shewanella violacea (strain JCM 10179 / CIP 106290 / LMG 19151 / DSS12) TaxID=637905 RepID=D4ZJN6_SHEVD|nr:hypothetical protein SVI_1914 [Shewanella violacea DSS12]
MGGHVKHLWVAMLSIFIWSYLDDCFGLDMALFRLGFSVALYVYVFYRHKKARNKRAFV